MELFREDLLLRMGNLIGKVVWVDQTTLATARGRFARVCAEVELHKLLVQMIKVLS